MSTSNELNMARMQLEESLGEENKTRYFHLIKQWFKMKSTREEFYAESKKLLKPDQLHLHNNFLLNLFNTCQFPITSNSVPLRVKELPSYKASPPREKEKEKDREKSKKDKTRPRKRTRSDRGFDPSDVSDINGGRTTTLPPQALEEPLRFIQDELFLPDTSFILGRILLCAWDHGLDGGNELAAEYMVVAVQHFLKNVLTSIFSQRSGYKVREGRFQHSLGTSLPNPWLRNSGKIRENTRGFAGTEIDDETEEVKAQGQRPTFEELEQRAAFELACCTKPTAVKPPVTAFHLLEALMSEPSVVPCHRVHSVNIERIFSRLSHPSHEELEKEN